MYTNVNFVSHVYYNRLSTNTILINQLSSMSLWMLVSNGSNVTRQMQRYKKEKQETSFPF